MCRKICVKCGQRKNRKSFSKHIRFKDGLDTRCKKCVKKESKIRNKLHKNSPDKPDKCPICKKFPQQFKSPEKWHLDHDPVSKKFRGWLCESCNMSIGNLGDSIDGILNALDYLLATTHLDTDTFNHIRNRLVNCLNNLLIKYQSN